MNPDRGRAGQRACPQPALTTDLFINHDLLQAVLAPDNLRRAWQRVKSNKWTVNYKPVTEYIRRGRNTDPNAKMPEVKPAHGPKAPTSDSMTMTQ